MPQRRRRPLETRPPSRTTVPLSRNQLTRLGAGYWWVVIIATFFTLARFSEAFLILRAQSLGLSLALVPLVLVVMNVAYAASAYPAGVLSDGIDRMTILVGGLGVLVAADLTLAFVPGLAGVWAGFTLWGVHMGLTQGLLATLVADTAPPDLRGTAFGVFHLVTGGALLAASVIAGMLWDLIGPTGTFIAGASFATFAMLALILTKMMTRQ